MFAAPPHPPAAPPPPSAPRPAPNSVVGFGPFFLLLFGGIWALVGGLLAVVLALVGRAPWNDVVLHGSQSFGGLAALIPLGGGVLGALLAGVGLVLGSRRRALYRDGTAAQARVLAVDPTNMRVNRQRVFRVTFTFSTPSGEVTTHDTSRVPPSPGATTWVVYDPARPERAVLA